MNAKILATLSLLTLAAVIADRPPSPPGLRVVRTARSPKGKELLDSLNKRMIRGAATRTIVPAPSTNLTVTNIVLQSGQVTLSWPKVSSPFQIEGKPALGDSWTAIGNPTI